MAHEATQLFAGGYVPQPKEAVVAAGDERLAAGTEDRTPDSFGMAKADSAHADEGSLRQRVAVEIDLRFSLFCGRLVTWLLQSFVRRLA
jgi:hypothetical protein